MRAPVPPYIYTHRAPLSTRALELCRWQAHKQYSNMDRLMHTINSKFDQFGVHVAYGTLADYFKLLATDEPSAPWPSYTHDFFPLATNQNVYSDQVAMMRSARPGHGSARDAMTV